MSETIEQTLARLEAEGNLRHIPADGGARVDLSSNDYLGIASRADLREEFFASVDPAATAMSASASRLLARRQASFNALESLLEELYGRPALIFNSGYHANTGLISALATKGTIVLADKLVHASIIDGIKLSGAPFERFRHNDMAHLARLAAKAADAGLSPIIVAESVYSMDGDRADIEALAAIRRATPGALLYIDEAHAVGVEGSAGLGLAKASAAFDDVDIIIGTFGKALCSTGAFAVLSPTLRSFAVNRARSFIFSTALPPFNIDWTRFILSKTLGMDAERSHLRALSQRLNKGLRELGSTSEPSHIQPLIVGDARRAVELSHRLADEGFDVLPIRTPTVPPGTERLRISLSAALADADIDAFLNTLNSTLQTHTSS